MKWKEKGEAQLSAPAFGIIVIVIIIIIIIVIKD